MVEEKIYYRYMGEHSQREAGTSETVQCGHDQTELSHVGREGMRCSREEGKGTKRECNQNNWIQ